MSLVKAKKSFGQHFLKSPETAKKIADCLNIEICKNSLEIGPGMGILTTHLLQKPILLKVIEVDRDSIAYLLTHKIIAPENCIQGDFLKLSMAEIFNNQEFSIVGNFPYNISTQIVFRIIENRQLIPTMTGMFQREVAQRICSPKGSKEYGILSVLVQAFFDTEYHFTIQEDEFIPPPKVKSGVISLTRKANLTLPCNEKLFFEVVKTAFNQRRKMLSNSLKKMLNEVKLEEKLGNLRPEQLNVDDFIKLTNFIDTEVRGN